MPDVEGRRTDDARMAIKALAWYLHRGYPLEVHEPMVRARRGRRATHAEGSRSR